MTEARFIAINYTFVCSYPAHSVRLDNRYVIEEPVIGL